MALIVSEQSCTGLHNNLRTLHMFMSFLRFFLRSKMQWHLFCYLILARK